MIAHKCGKRLDTDQFRLCLSENTVWFIFLFVFVIYKGSCCIGRAVLECAVLELSANSQQSTSLTLLNIQITSMSYHDYLTFFISSLRETYLCIYMLTNCRLSKFLWYQNYVQGVPAYRSTQLQLSLGMANVPEKFMQNE